MRKIRPRGRPLEKYLGQQVKLFRKSGKLTQKELAELADVPFATINRLERGKANPTLKTVSKILAVFGHYLKVERREIDGESDT